MYGREVCTGEDNGLPLCETDEQRRITNVNADNHWVVDNRSYTYTEPEFDASPNAYNQFRIIGINQDIAADGSNAGLTFMATH